MFFFFFFQAEDGIRDWSVTGVQTCALPISCARRYVDGLRERRTRSDADAVTNASGNLAARSKGVRHGATDFEVPARVVRVEEPHLRAKTGLRIVVQWVQHERRQCDSAEGGTADKRAV